MEWDTGGRCSARTAARRWRQTYNLVLQDEELRILTSTFHLEGRRQ